MLEETESCVKQKLQCLVKKMKLDSEDLTMTVINTSFLQTELFSSASARTIAEEAGSSQSS